MGAHEPVPADVSDLEDELIIPPRSVRYVKAQVRLSERHDAQPPSLRHPT